MGAYGPSGGQGGFEVAGRQPLLGMSQIIVWSGASINGIGFTFPGETDPYVFGNKDTGPLNPPVPIRGDEYIVRISGTYDIYVSSIVIATNKQTLAYGYNITDAKFDYELEPGEYISGFLGRTGAVIDAIGIFTQKQP